MKLTKSQRLFVKAGEALATEKLDKYYDKFISGYSKEISEDKRKRKKFIREAIKAYDEESLEKHTEGFNAGQLVAALKNNSIDEYLDYAEENCRLRELLYLTIARLYPKAIGVNVEVTLPTVMPEEITAVIKGDEK